tara:strand:- start:58 stop:279 length:222 start_codon:yes stop_codon:yes gene_type:complete
MRYERQINGALDSMDVSLNQLYMLIKKGKQKEALEFMDSGDLKEKFADLRNIITISSTTPLGARGTANSSGMF